MKYCFGIDIGGTTVKMGLFQEDGELLDKWEIKTRTENQGEAILPDIAQAVKAKMAEKKLEQITQMELESMGALLELPELPRMPRLPDRRYHGRREETTANIVIESESVSAEDAQEPISEESYSVEDILQEVHGQTPQQQKPQETQKRQETQKAQNVQEAQNVQKMPQGGAVDSAQLLEGLLRDPQKLAGDLELLTRALQGLSDDLRRAAAQQEEVDR